MTLKKISLTLMLLTVMLIPAGNAYAFLFVSEGHIQAAPAKFTGIVEYTKNTETLTESIEFTYNPTVGWNPLILFAVPAKPQIELPGSDEALNRLSQQTEKKFQKTAFWQKLIFPDIIEEPYASPGTFSRSVAIVELNVFTPQEGGKKLLDWFSANSYLLPKNGKKMIAEYIGKGWYFIAAKLDIEHTERRSRDKLLVHEGHTAPIRITFQIDSPVIPLRLASIQPDFDSLETPFIDRWYGKTMEDLGAQKNERLDEMLSTPSQLKFPQLPLDLSVLHTEFYVYNEDKTDIPGYIAQWADRVNHNNKIVWLTKLTGFTPFLQLEDIKLEKAKDNRRVNPEIGPLEFFLRLGGLLLILFFAIYSFLQKPNRRRLAQKV